MQPIVHFVRLLRASATAAEEAAEKAIMLRRLRLLKLAEVLRAEANSHEREVA